mmetsp:Transcript_18318/g.46253  ORF Transcript_18318/g.46253 Transcript_18318/m.46253 type:complete len:218 (+) Transcript_18318:440-1093(+)
MVAIFLAAWFGKWCCHCQCQCMLAAYSTGKVHDALIVGCLQLGCYATMMIHSNVAAVHVQMRRAGPSLGPCVRSNAVHRTVEPSNFRKWLWCCHNGCRATNNNGGGCWFVLSGFGKRTWVYHDTMTGALAGPLTWEARACRRFCVVAFCRTFVPTCTGQICSTGSGWRGDAFASAACALLVRSMHGMAWRSTEAGSSSVHVRTVHCVVLRGQGRTAQ